MSTKLTGDNLPSTNNNDNPLLDDVIISKILSYLNFNEIYNMRLVCKRFKKMADDTPITRLIIYEKHPPLPGKFKMIDEKFGLEDTVYVYDLNKFFNTKSIIKKRKESISKLIIYGLDSSLTSLKVSFNKLQYLELKDVNFSDATILKSPNLKQLSVFRTSFMTSEKYGYLLNKNHPHPSLLFNHILGLSNLAGKLKRYANHITFYNSSMELAFFKLCVNSNVFSELEILETNLDDLSTLIYLSEKMPSLKQIHIFCSRTFEIFQDTLKRNPLDSLVSKLRKDLAVYLFGVPLLKDKIQIITNFFQRISDCVKLNIPIQVSKDMMLKCGSVYLPNSRLAIETNKLWYDQQKIIDANNELFSGFINLVDTICFKPEVQVLTMKRFYQQFKNIKTVTYMFWSFANFELPNYFELFDEIRDLRLISMPRSNKFAYGNNVFSQIPDYCTKLISLHIEYWNSDANFDFLLRLNPQIKWVKLLLRHPISDQICLDFLSKYGNQHLAYFEVYFQLLNKTREQLGVFKNKVLKLIQGMKNKSLFKIQIHQNSGVKVVRCVYRRDDLCRYEMDNLDVSDSELSKIIFCIKEKQDTNI